MEEEILLEIQGNRPRSRTWPLPQPEDLVVDVDKNQEETATKLDNAKKSSRKNAWGNLSYADLITQAITSSPEQRMTLSQIYSWMVENIPYFKDKGDSTSSAGWKNSIRHNLSLHSRFMRVQNEGNGKSSWWILNHDAKAEKTKRRSRSSSLDSDAGGPKLKTKRGRKATKRCEIDERPQSPKSRSTLTPKSPTGEPSVIIEDNPFPFANSDYRTRSSSNTSNVSSIGRLSPIHDEDEVSMTMSPAHEHGKSTPMDELMDNMKENLSMSIVQSQGDITVKSTQQFEPLCNNNSDTNMAAQVMNIDSPSTFVDNRYTTSRNDYCIFNPQMKIHQPKSVYPDASMLHSNGLYQQQQQSGNGVSSPSLPFTLPERAAVQQQQPQQQQPQFVRQPPSYNHAVIMNNYLHKQKEQQCNFQTNNFVQQQLQPFDVPNTYNSTLPLINIEMADKLPVDVEVDYLEGDIECDVENVLRKELAFNDGYLDFNLDNYVPSIALPESVPLTSYVAGNMVH